MENIWQLKFFEIWAIVIFEIQAGLLLLLKFRLDCWPPFVYSYLFKQNKLFAVVSNTTVAFQNVQFLIFVFLNEIHSSNWRQHYDPKHLDALFYMLFSVFKICGLILFKKMFRLTQ